MPAGSILVADDDAAIRTVLNQALSRAGYEVRSTGNAATLWRWISQGDGDLKMETTALTRRTIQLDSTAHHFHQTFNDRQSKTGAAKAACGGIIDLRERLKQAVQAGFGDANPRVAQVEA